MALGGHRMPIINKGPFKISRTGNSRQIVLLCHGGWEPTAGLTDVPRGTLVHFYTKHGQFNRGEGAAKAILGLGPGAYPGAVWSPGMPARPANISDDNWNNYLAQQGASIARGEGCTYVFESIGASIEQVQTHNYNLCLIGPDNIIRPGEKALLDEHDAGQFAAGDVDLMILKRSYLKTTNLAKAFEISTKVNGGRPYAVFHYCPCRFVEARYMDAPTGDGDDDDAGE